jgi:hypothetical protein
LPQSRTQKKSFPCRICGWSGFEGEQNLFIRLGEPCQPKSKIRKKDTPLHTSIASSPPKKGERGRVFFHGEKGSALDNGQMLSLYPLKNRRQLSPFEYVASEPMSDIIISAS